MNRILILSTTYFPYIGGAEVAVKEITDRIPDADFDMVTLRFDSGLPRRKKIGNIDVHRIGFTKKDPSMEELVSYPLMLNKYLYTFHSACTAHRLHKKKKYDLIWSVMASYAGFGGLFFKLANPKVPFLLTLQEGDPLEFYQKRVGPLHPLYKMIFKKADRIQTISTFLADYARKQSPETDIEVVPNGVDIENFSREHPESQLNELKNKLGKKTDDQFLITTSRLVLKNSINDVIRALPLLPANVKFLILGIGPDEYKLKELAQELGVSNRTIFLGQVGHKDIAGYLKISDIFIRPSLSEGLGNSFLEAMAAGIPVIATPVGGIPDFLFDPFKNPDKDPTGLFCEVGDPQSIAEKVKLLIDSRQLREKLIANSMKMVRANYSWNAIAEKMNAVFKF